MYCDAAGLRADKIQCSVCEAQYDNITEYTHHLNTHSQAANQVIDDVKESRIPIGQ